ncbi:MAG TPA: protein kinase [Candidatus Sulfotelmatobacter sp.]|nr:protein kinase [Candidatus Sulfotelmatobacter sp.]
MPLEPGTKIGQYEILSPLGAGSMGEVYRARDPRLERDVAIKVLPDLASLDPERLIRFEQEAKAAAALNHPNILAVYQMGTYLNMPYLVSELLEGKTLTETIRRGPLSLRKVIDYGAQIAHGLAAAHAKGIIHRDLKPDNLFVTKDGRIKILDFGLAKLIQPKQTIASVAATITLPGMALGTVGYMAPEQIRGLHIDQRSDIFALGSILYELVTGKQSFGKPTSADTISAILNEELPSFAQLSPDTPAALERVIRRCLEKDPSLRFQSASDLAFALEALLDPALAAPSGAHPLVPEEKKRPRVLWAVSAVAVALLAIAVVGYILLQPVPQPSVTNYVQLTHGGQPKSLIGTDGARLYLGIGASRSASFVQHSVAEMSVSGGDPKQIATMNSSDMIPVDLSPDGSELLFVDGQGSPPRGPLKSLPFLSGSPRRIGNLIAETADWSPDGKLLSYTNLGDLFVANADGTGSRKIASVQGDILNVTWSPDQRHLRFDSSETAGTVGQQIEREVAIDGSDIHPLFPGWHNPPDECCGRWTPDGKYFIFQSQGQLWALANRAPLFHGEPKPVQLTFSPMTLSSPLPSKDGKKIFLIGQTYRGQLMGYDAKSSQFTPALGGLSAEFIAYSKDGQWIAYVSYPDGALWRSRVNGTDRLQLTFPPRYPVLPRWSPDGKTILFFEFAVGSTPARIYTISPDGGTPAELLPDDHSQQLDPNWSPDGTKIIFANESNDPSSAIHVLDLATKKISNLPDSQGLYSPRWSPDSKYISAFSGDSKRLLLFDLQTHKWTQLFSGSMGWLNWSHDGQYVYALDYSGRSAIIRVRIADRKVEQVADVQNLASTGHYGTALALTPDDQPLILHDTGTVDVYSVDWRAK